MAGATTTCIHGSGLNRSLFLFVCVSDFPSLLVARRFRLPPCPAHAPNTPDGTRRTLTVSINDLVTGAHRRYQSLRSRLRAQLYLFAVYEGSGGGWLEKQSRLHPRQREIFWRAARVRKLLVGWGARCFFQPPHSPSYH